MRKTTIRSSILKVAVALCFMTTAASVSATENTDKPVRPAVSEKPYAMMQQLAPLLGSWSMVTSFSQDGGKTWQQSPPVEVEVKLSHKGMLLSEEPKVPSETEFNMRSFISYDQYRNVYRNASVDDVWGIMDLYEGTIEDGKLVMTNLKSGTFFPISETAWRAFRLTFDLTAGKRQLHIEASDDGGKTWAPSFEVTYTAINTP
ncbi:hypothetical protein GCM10017044_12510 [Kordiimonas sediminis]|uniref:DUF1579 domain-containing protein n=1 Tax=Kordiimonas sediminis TaxID=1735581 RepID=A0A919AQB3_9PROT|nr:DUF1579 family protein [Kordiimonas sediminis]GHF19396.1 hypothetical protein GCM10017044_12510 [Kordiimonas sediminis]